LTDAATTLTYRAPAEDRGAAAPVVRAVVLVAAAAGAIKLAGFMPLSLMLYRNGSDGFTADWPGAAALAPKLLDVGVSAALLAVGVACLRHPRPRALRLLRATIAAWLVALACEFGIVVLNALLYELQFPGTRNWLSIGFSLVSSTADAALVALTPLLVLWLLRRDGVPRGAAQDMERS
jgi:hypothetical protein